MRLLIAEDDPIQAELVSAALVASGNEVTVACDGQAALEQLRSGEFSLVVSDWEMPGMTGLELCRAIRQRPASSYVYVILLTSRAGSQNVVDGLEAGADDFLTKPFHPQELICRVRTGQRILSLQSRDMTIFALAKLAESRDPETGAHLERIREYCRVLATRLGETPEFREAIDGEFCQLIYITSPLHDIGKVGVPDEVLLKPGRLTAAEFAIMKRHAVVGGETLDALLDAYPDAGFLQMARDIAWTHHEKYDGSGYPNGLRGDQIPLCGRIVAVADVYDALTTKRVYKDAFSHEKACEMITEGRGRHFDPTIVDVFLDEAPRFQEIRQAYSNRDERTPGKSLHSLIS